jgi:type II secretory pathway component PulJ
MEVVVALGIMSLVMVALYTTLNSTLRARDKLENEARVARLGPDLLDIIESDLRRIWLMNIEQDRVFLGETRTLDGEPADSLSFLSTVDSTVTRRIGEREIPSDLCETGYRLRRNADLPDVMELWRRQSYHIDEKPLQDGVYELLHDRVVSFQVRYLDELDRYAERLTDWDTTITHRLPAAVEIELALEAVPRTTEDFDRRGSDAFTLRYKRLIPLQARSELVMRVHPVAPTFVAAEGAFGGPGGGPDDGQDGEPDGDGQKGPPGPDGDGGGGDGGNDFGDALDEVLGGLGGGGG